MVAEPIIETVFPNVYVPNIWVDLTATTIVETREQRYERKRKRKDTKEVEKRARAESI